ncbi:MAG: cobalamin-dependent protein [Magnetococcales bacterium]|nr:cobalamin-dependent protein [Magnetococcales bacterium]
MAASIVLVHPHVSLELQYGSRYRWAGAVLPPLGILYIAGVLEKNGYRVAVIDANALRLEAHQVIERVKALNPDVVGLTGTSLSFPENVKIARLLRAWRAEVPIVLGGVHAQGDPEGSARTGAFDYVIPGEGEVTFLELVRVLESRGEVETVPGLVYPRGEEIVNSGPGRLVENLDDLPFPARHLLHDLTAYHQKAFGFRLSPHTTLFTQRGCPFQCIFCSSSKQFRSVFNSRVRAHSMEYLREEIGLLRRQWGIRELYLSDDTFNLKRSRVAAFCAMMRTHFPGMLWSCNFEANILGEEMLREMKASGCWLIQVGVETGNAEIMKEIHKGVTIEQYRELTEMAHRLGLAIKVSFILGNPRESEATVEESIRFAESLPVHYITFGMMAPLPGSFFWETAPRFGTVDYESFDRFSMVGANFVPTGLTREFLQKKQKEAHRRVYFRLGMMRRHLKLIRSPSDVVRYAQGVMTLLL